MMKKILIVFLVFCYVPAQASSTIIGVDRSKVILWEFWKCEKSKITNEFLIYNPRDQEISITIRKYKSPREDDVELTYEKSDTILVIKKLKPYDYKFSPSNVLRDRHEGWIEIMVNNKRCGTYVISPKVTLPKTKLKNGIISNVRMNVGKELGYEISYSRLKFKRCKKRTANVLFPNTNYKHAGFPKGEKYNPWDVKILDFKTYNLKQTSNNSYDFKTEPEENTNEGRIKIAFLIKKWKNRRFLQRNFSCHFHGWGQTIGFPIPVNINFRNKNKMLK